MIPSSFSELRLEGSICFVINHQLENSKRGLNTFFSSTRSLLKEPHGYCLEGRLLLDAALVSTALDTVVGAHETAEQAQNATLEAERAIMLSDKSVTPLSAQKISLGSDGSLQIDSDLEEVRADFLESQNLEKHHIVILDSEIDDIESFRSGLTLQAEIFVLNKEESGIQQISEIISHYSSGSIASLHLVSHGGAGFLELGSGLLDFTHLSASQKKLISSLDTQFSAEGEIFVYGCSFAEGVKGQKAVKTLSRLTQSMVSASDDPTGLLRLGGDWELEVQSGKREFQTSQFSKDHSIFTLEFQQNHPTLLSAVEDVDVTTSGKLLRWYDASDIDANKVLDVNEGTTPLENSIVTSWQDKSGKDKDATRGVLASGSGGIFTQSTAPGGQVSIQFDNNTYYEFERIDVLASGNDEGSFIAVLNFSDFTTSSSYTATIIGDSPTGGTTPYLGPNTTQTRSEVGGGTTLQTGRNISSPDRLDRSWRNGDEFNTISAPLPFQQWGISSGLENDFGTGDGVARIGIDRNIPETGINGYVSEVIFYDEFLTDAEMVLIHNYLGTKWGINLTDDDFFDETQAGSTYRHELGGIYREGSRRVEIGSSGGMEISNATSLGNNDALVAAHDNQSGFDREWWIDETNNVGNVDLKFTLSEMGITNAQNGDTIHFMVYDSGAWQELSTSTVTGSGVNAEIIFSNQSVSDCHYKLDPGLFVDGDKTGNSIEDSGLSTTGTIGIYDTNGITGNTFQVQTNVSTSYGFFTLDSLGSWSYSLDNTNSSVNSLNAGASLTDNITILSSDNSLSEIITITITGVNDPAVIGGELTGSVTEETTTPFSGTATISDVDSGEASFIAVSSPATLSYGSYTLSSAGVWNYTLDTGNASVQALAVGGSLTDSFTLVSADNTSASVVITITGVNDPAVIGGELTGSVTEETTTPFSGTATISDVDSGEASFIAVSSPATLSYGSYTLNSAGVWNYTLDTGNASVQALAVGGSLTDSFTLVSADNTSASVVITITGVNDPAVIGGELTGSVTEETTTPFSGTATISDVDSGEASFIAVSSPAALSYGSYTLSSAGVWNYTLDTGNASVQALAVGGSLTDSFTLVSADNTSASVVITITGVNDPAVIGGDLTGSVTEETTTPFSGTATISDVDSGEASFIAVSSPATLSYGSYTLSSSGVWNYTLDTGNASVQALAVGGSLTDSFTLVSADNTSASVVITITGVNDPAVIGGDLTGSVTEETTTPFSGTATISDVDSGEASFIAVSSPATLSYGSYTLSSSGVWNYTLDTGNASVQALAVGGSLTDSFTLVSADNTSASVVITITGVNDPAVIGGELTGSVTEETTTPFSGTATISDVDSGEASFIAVSSPAALSYGSYTLSSAGVWNYTLDTGNASVQALAVGGSLTDSFTLVSADNTSASVVITITGVNDPAVIGGDLTGSVTEETTTPFSGTATISDVDSGEASFIAVSSPATLSYGSYTLSSSGVWNYTLDTGNASVQALAVGGSLTDSFTLVSADNTSASVVITITGVNDPAVIGGDLTGSVTEETTTPFSGTATISDVDSGEASFIAVSSPATLSYGSYTLSSSGVWNYTLDTGNASVQALAVGGSLTDSFTLVSADNTSASVVITITGVNDPAVIGGELTGSVTEETTTPFSGTATISDVDSGEASFIAVSSPATLSYGSYTLSSAGVWNYTLDTGNASVQALAVGGSLTDSFTLVSADNTSASVVITITGVNDPAVIGGDLTGSVTEETTTPFSGTATISDVDSGEASFIAVSSPATLSYGSYTLSSSGVWNYTLDTGNASVQALAVGGSLTDSFTLVSADNTSASVVITITGVNDPAVIGGELTGSVTEETTTPFSGTATISDVDSGEASFIAVSSPAALSYGSYTLSSAGVWNYTLDTGNASVQALAVGGSLTDSFTLVSADNTSASVVITITGVNDPAVIGGDLTGSVTEETTTPFSGTATISDVDSGEASFIAVSSPAALSYGSYTLSSAGVWNYTLDTGNASVQALAVGGSLTDSFTLVSADNTSASVVITITGVNDPAVIGGDLTGSVTEETTTPFSGTATISDVDSGEASFIAVSSPATLSYGSYTLSSSGVWNYTLDTGNASVQALAVGGSLTDSFTLVSADNTSASVVITITGVNDPAVIGGDLTGSVTEETTTPFSGTATISDVDSGEASFIAVSSPATLSYGSYTLSSAGVWNYTLDTGNASVQALAVGGSLTDSFTLVSADNTSASVVITITGVNDPAVIGGDLTGSVTEETTTPFSGTATISDVDSGEASFIAVSSPATLSYGSYTLSSSGVWNYTLDTGNASVQALAIGGSLTDSFTLVSADNTSASVVITITGVNDPAVIGGDLTGSVTEETTTPFSGTATISDVDSGEASFIAVSSPAALSYGSYTLSSAGVWNYTLDTGNASVQALAVGGSLTDSFTLVSADNTSASVVITITGVNDPAVIGGDLTGSVTEETTTPFSGTATISDVDSGEASFIAVSSPATLSYGSYTLSSSGVWNYTLDTGNASVQALAVGGSLTDSFTLVSADNTSASVVITITGVNDPAVIGGDLTGSVTEETTTPFSGTATISDVDSGEASFIAVSSPATLSYGSYTLSSSGVWNYTLDTGNASVQALAVGGSLTDSFTLVSADNTSASVVITITGVNDPAVIGGDLTGSVTEETPLLISGILTNSDPDMGETGFTATPNFINTPYGRYFINASGTWAYGVDNSNSTVQALAAGVTLTDSFTVTAGDGTTSQTIMVTITGVNDPAVIGGELTKSLTEETLAPISGTLTNSDIDTGETGFIAVASPVNLTHGNYTLTSAGVWNYTLDTGNATVQALALGTSLTDSFTVVAGDGVTFQTVTITINGENDLAIIGGELTGAIMEDDTSPVLGTLTNSDIDAGETGFIAVNSPSSTNYGSYTLTSGGVWSYILDNGNANIQALASGVSLTDSFTVMAGDGTTSQTIMVTITGANDPAVIGGDFTGSVTEETIIPILGTLTNSDPDTGETGFVAVNSPVTTNYGSYTLTSAGVWNYTLSTGNTSVQALASGASLTDNFTVMAGDGTTSQAVTITITGENDAAVIGGNISSDILEGASVPVTGTLTNSDPDIGEVGFIASAGVLTYGNYSVNASGEWSYTLNNGNPVIQTLPENATLTDSFTVMAGDGTTSQAVTITITGIDNIATISGDITSIIFEDTSTPIMGNLTNADTDVGHSGFIAVTSPAVTSYGSYTLTSTGEWTYILDNGNSSVQALATGSILTDSFTVFAGDAITSQTITVTINGENDLANIQGNLVGNILEDAISPVIGMLTNSDPDTGETGFVAVSSPVTTGYGGYTLTSTGEWTYILDNGNSTVQALALGASLTDSFTVTAGDGITSQTITLTITGENDSANIQGDSAGNILEDSTSPVTGMLTNSDPDMGETGFIAVNSPVTTNYGSYTLTSGGSWSYTLDTGNLIVQALAVSTIHLTDSFTVMAGDGVTSQTVTITITGENDSADIQGDTAGNILEDAQSPVTGTLTNSDPDTGETGFIAVSSPVTLIYGEYTLTSAGVWNYALNTSSPAVQALADGVSVTDNFLIMAGDGITSQEIMITITGENDPALISGHITGSVTEKGLLPISGNLTNSDPDTGENGFISLSGNTAFGMYVISPNGVWIYTHNREHPTVQALSEGTTLTDSFTVMAGDGITSQTVTMTITGENDSAIIGGELTKTLTEETTTPVSGSLTNSDPDTGETGFIAVSSPVTTSYGSYTLSSAGDWNYTLDTNNSTVQALALGASLTDSFTVTAGDGTTSQIITMTITGENDPAIISGDLTADVAGDHIFPVTGMLAISDPDGMQGSFIASIIQMPSDYGNYTITSSGIWEYILDTGNAVVQALPSGVSLIDSFTISSDDGTTKEITITITGKNDVAVIGGDLTASLTGDSLVPVTGMLTISDPDSGEGAFITVSTPAETNYGSYTLTSTGVWEYTLDTTNSMIQALVEGDSLADYFTISSADGTSETIRVTVIGVEDEAIISGDLMAVLLEHVTEKTTGVLRNSDPDTGQSGFVADSGSTVYGGTYSITAEGIWTYTLNVENITIQELEPGSILIDSFTVMAGDQKTTQNIIIDIVGCSEATDRSIGMGSLCLPSEQRFSALDLILQRDLLAQLGYTNAYGARQLPPSYRDGILEENFYILGYEYNATESSSSLDHINQLYTILPSAVELLSDFIHISVIDPMHHHWYNHA